MRSVYGIDTLSRGIEYYNKGLIKRAEDSFKDALMQNSRSETAYYYLGVISIMRDEYDQAIDYLIRLTEYNYFYKGVHYCLGIAYKKKNDFQKALQEFDRSIKNYPTAKAYFNIGVIHSQRHEYDQAVYAFKKSLSLDRNNVYSRYNLANIYESQGKYRDALTEYNKVLRKRPKYISAYYRKGRALMAMKRYNEAVIEFMRTIELDENFSSGYLGVAMAYEELKRVDDANTYYKKYAQKETNEIKRSQALQKAHDVLYEVKFVDDGAL
ncbi:MAG: tetratricopeptide repeat protein [Candidatus Ancaeobacter aquaticus]|nr:tetratricopeptide repeat protein [Candidatus Ancaeobacter aquaticus]